MVFWKLVWHEQCKTLYQNCVDICMHVFSSCTMYHHYHFIRRNCTDSPFRISSP